MLHVQIAGELKPSVDFDLLTLEVQRSITFEQLTQQTVVTAELPHTFNLHSGRTTPAGTVVLVTARATLGEKEVGRAYATGTLRDPAETLMLTLLPPVAAECTPTSATEVCDNPVDDDCDGLRECQDPDCAGKLCGPNGAICGNANICVCNGSGAPETTEQSCSDGRDNDCDGLTDCQDPDCAAKTCSATMSTLTCDAAQACTCPLQERRFDTARSGPSALVVGENAAVKLLYMPSAGGGVFYSECSANCASTSPTLSTPVQITPLTANANLRPLMVAAPGGALEAAFRSTRNGIERVSFATCASSCNSAASWTLRDFNGDGTAAGFDSTGTVRAVAHQGNINGTSVATYAECAGTNCATAGATWSTVQFNFDPFGASIALTPLAGGGLKRTAIFGAENGTGIFYAECTTNCGDTAGWSTVTLTNPGPKPELVVDKNGLPRIFHTDNSTPLRLRCTRCTQAPCTTAANWTSTELSTNATQPVIGAGNQGATFFAMSSGGNVMLGTEGATGGYVPAQVPSCMAAMTPGTFAAATQDAAGRWHFSYAVGTEQRVLSQLR
ncbi:MAG: hypothetical protein ACT4TC_19550 [Myxococcaceae bacterium]